jgi:undecaprenyl diphosphate synthase
MVIADPADARHPVGRAAPPPRHVACIMDGNGRWATKRGLLRIDGHSAGEAAILDTIDGAIDSDIAWLTLFAFSTENWGRPRAEVAFLMEFNRRLILKHGDTFHSKGVRVRYLSRGSELIPARLRDTMRSIEARTKENSVLTLTFAFDYGGRSALVDAARSLVADGVNANDVTERSFSARFQFPDMPDPDLIIRTAGEYRLSNFLLWGAAYAELVFLDVLWPDFRAVHLRESLRVYAARSRRFGELPDMGTVDGIAEAP